MPKFSGERVLIAGGTGIVGFGIVQAMLKQGTKVSNSFTDLLMEVGTIHPRRVLTRKRKARVKPAPK